MEVPSSGRFVERSSGRERIDRTGALAGWVAAERLLLIRFGTASSPVGAMAVPRVATLSGGERRGGGPAHRLGAETPGQSFSWKAVGPTGPTRSGFLVDRDGSSEAIPIDENPLWPRGIAAAPKQPSLSGDAFWRCREALGRGAETSGVLDFGVLDVQGTEAPGRAWAWSRVTFRLRNIPALRSRQPDHTPNVPGARPAPGRQGCVLRDTLSIGPTPMLPGALSLRNSPNDLWTARGPERRQ